MKTIVLLVIGFCSATLSQAQITYEKAFGGMFADEGAASIQLSNGSFLTAGSVGNENNTNVLLINTSAAGDTLWTKTYGGNGNDHAYALTETADGGILITGSTTSFGTGSTDVYAVKTDANGNMLWFKTYGGVGDDAGMSVLQSGDGYMIAGTTSSFGAGGNDIYVLSIGLTGNLHWAKTYGGAGDEYGNSIALTSDGGFFITGSSNSFNGVNADVYLVKTDGSGNKEWSRTYGKSAIDYGKAGMQTADGGYIAVGTSYSFGSGHPAIYLLRTDANGAVVFSKTFTGDSNDFGRAVKQTADNGFVIAGSTTNVQGNTDVCLIKTDSTGEMMWNGSFGDSNDETAEAVIETSNGQFMITGTTASFGSGNKDLYLIKTNTEGGTSCDKKLCMINEHTVETPDSVVTDSTAAVDGTSVSDAVIAAGQACGVVTRCFNDENALNEETGVIDDSVSAIIASSEVNDIRSLSTSAETAVPVTLYPNPGSGQFNFSGVKAGEKLEVFDIRGKLIMETICAGDLQTIDITGEERGLYFYRITDNSGFVTSGKIIKD